MFFSANSRLNVCVQILETMCFTKHSKIEYPHLADLLICAKSWSALTVSVVMFDVYMPQRTVEIHVSFKCDSIWPSVCLARHTKKIKVFWANVIAFEELCFSPSGPSLADTSLSLPYTCLFIFSVFSSPTIPGVCCGPESCSWSSANLERSSAFLEIWEGKRHKTGCKPRSWIHKLFTCATKLSSLHWFIRPQPAMYHVILPVWRWIIKHALLIQSETL